MSAFYNLLEHQWLYKEIYTKLSLSAPAYRYWQSPTLKLNRYLFLQKGSLPERYSHIEPELTDLSGYLPTLYASQQMGMDSHIFNYKKMRLYGRFEYKFVGDVKFVNLRRFFLEHNIRIKKESIVRLGRLDELVILSDATFYRIDDQYGVVVYG